MVRLILVDLNRYSIEKEWRESAGTLLFIGIFLSVDLSISYSSRDLLQADFRGLMRIGIIL